MNVRKTVEIMASYEAEMGTSAGERGLLGLGFGNGRTLIIESLQHLATSLAHISSSANAKTVVKNNNKERCFGNVIRICLLENCSVKIQPIRNRFKTSRGKKAYQLYCCYAF